MISRSLDQPAHRTGDEINHRYRVVRQLGAGGMGRVYLVQDLLQDERQVALKTLRTDLGDPAYYDYFSHEFEALTKLKHPNLAEVYDFGRVEHTGELFFTLEYVVGRNLFDATADADVPTILDYLVQTCRALAYIHSRGLIHHDVKPENVLVVPVEDGPDQIKLLDFGLALEEDLAQSVGEIRGTLVYLAPEVAAGYPYDRRSDFYSLGIVLYRVLRRVLPFEERRDDEPVFSLVPPPPDPSRIERDERFRPLVGRLTEPDPSERFADAGQIVAEINQLFDTDYAVETKETAAGYVLSGQLVGRKREREQMERMMDDLRRGAPSVPLLLIGGEVGMGKTRLVREWKVKCQLAGIEFVSARCYESVGAPYGPVVDLLRQLVSLVGPDGELVGRHRDALARLLPALSDADEPADEPDVPTGPRERLRLIHGLARFVLDMAVARPLVIGIADLQWADSETVELLKHIVRTVVLEFAAAGGGREGGAVRKRARPGLLICGAYREEELPETPLETLVGDLGQPFIERWHLRRLDTTEVGDFLRSMLGRGDVPRALIDRIADETDGNPYFIEELMKALAEEGQLSKRAGAWDVEVDPASLKIPSSCEQVIQRRLSLLDPAATEAIELLAVLEEPAPLPLLQAMLTGGDGLESRPAQARRGLRELQRQQLLRRQLDDDGYRYFLNHTSTRRVVYDHLPTERRALLHRRAAAGMEALLGEATDVAVRQLAHHHRRGGNTEAAIRYGLAAARESARLHAHQQAIAVYRDVFELLDEQDHDARFEVLRQLADLHKNVGQYATAKDYYHEAEALTPDGIERADLRRRLAEMTARRGLYPEALERYREVERALDDLASSSAMDAEDAAARLDRLRAQLLVGVGRVHELLGEYDRGVAQARRALSLEPPEEIRVTAYQLLGNLSWCLGRYPEAIEHHTRALEIEQSRANVFGLAACYNNLGLVYQDTGETDKALELYEQSLDGFRRYGDPSGIALCLSNLGVLQKERGAYERSVDCLERALTEYERLGDRIGVARINECLGEVYADIGQWADSERCHNRCLSICDETGNVPLSIYAYINLGQNYATFGALPQALEHADVALERATKINARMLVGAAELLKGDILRRRRDWEAAMEYLERAHELFIELGNRAEALKAVTLLARLFSELGEHRTALERAETALDDARDLGNRDLIAGLLQLTGVARQQLGRLSEARRDLQDALALARELNRRELLWGLHHDLGRLLAEAGELERARTELMRAVSLGRQIWQALPSQLKGLFLEDPRHVRLSEDVGELRKRMSDS